MIYTKNKTKALVVRLKRELAYLGREYRTLIKSPKQREFTFSQLLLCDNYYLIEETAKNAVQGIEQIRSRRSDIGFEYPRVFCHVSEFIDGSDEESFCEKELVKFLEGKQSADPYESDELYALGSMLSCAIVSKIYECIKCESSDDKKTDIFVKMLFWQKNIDFDEVFERVSRLEQIFSADPSGVYLRCDKETKAMYRKSIAYGAKKQKTGELEYATRLLAVAKSAKGEARALGYYLVKEEKHPIAAAYFPMTAVFVGALEAVYFFIVGHTSPVSYIAALFLLLPFFEVAKQIAQMIVSRIVKPRMLPRLKLDTIPDEARTLTVVTTLLFGEKSDAAIFDRLEDFCNLSPKENVYFGVLGDLRDGKDASAVGDGEIIDYARRRIEALNAKYGNRFVLFVRDRSYSIGEKKYMGWERKRGALIELVRLLRGAETSISTAVGDIEAVRGTKYVITLDSDTRLSHTSIKKLVGSAAHPQNRPKIEKTPHGAIVTEGYGIMQPRMISSLESVSRSYFSLMQCGSGGVEFYDMCEFNVYGHLFGEGIFCGKGIFDVDAFAAVIDGAFPEDSVLSHDLLEGTRLRAAYLGDIALVDSAPSSSLSYYDRLHRWIRGDVQSLAFCRAPINALSRFKLVDNLLRALTPVFALLTIITAAVAAGKNASATVFFALLYLMLPAFVSFISPIVSRNVGAYKIILRSYFSYAVSGIVKDAANMLYSISSLAYLSYVSLDAIVRALWRMLFSRQHMLEWTTAAESEKKKNTLSAYFLRMQISVWAGLLILVLTDELISDICALLFIAFPFAAYLLSKNIEKESRSFAAQKKQISEYARDMWSFFEDFVVAEDNYLPPDNYQILPKEATAHRTSPTNIGMYLVAALSARDFGFINSDELCIRLERTLSSVEKMEKWHGHLYNWYDTRTLALLHPSYVSTVDSGNFFCSLVTLREGVLEYAFENTGFLDIAKRIDALVGAVEFAPLYNPKRKLFYIGLDPSRAKFDENYYDLYMSEARLSSYFAVARGEISDEHWRALGRHFIGDGNHIGLASWSGTAFEYFMPALFLPVYPNSMAYEGLLFAFSINKKNGAGTKTDSGRYGVLWGKSESAFYSFDADMNYRYRAIGESKLGLVRGLEEDRVFAPYALFLMLKASVRDVLGGLSVMKEVGAYGKYGFYEAVDLTPSRVGGGRATVKSHMAHHMGMSIAACANACFDDILCRRFMRVPMMRASSLLLAEKLPADAIIYKKEVREVDEKSLQIIDRMRNRASARTGASEPSGDVLRAYTVSDGKLRALATSHTDVSFFYGDRAVSRPDTDSALAFSMMFESDGKIYPVLGKNVDRTQKIGFGSDNGKIFYNISYRGERKISASVNITLDSDRKMILLEFGAEGRFSSICPGIVFEPVLCRPEDYRAHSSFSKLFVESRFLGDEKILLYRRKGRAEKEADVWLGVAFAELGGEVEHAAMAQKVLPELFSSDDIEQVFVQKLECERDEELCACVDPICVMKRNSAAQGKYRCDIILALGNDMPSVVSNITLARRKKDRFSISAKKSDLYAKAKEKLAGTDTRSKEAASFILASLLHKTNFGAPKDNLRACPCSYGSLWKFGISGDEKIVFVDATDGAARAVIQVLVAAHKYLWLSGVRFELVIVYPGNNEYTNKEKAELERIILYSGSDEFVGRRGGIFLCARGALNQAEYELLGCIAALCIKLSPSLGVELALKAIERSADGKSEKKVIRRKSLPRTSVSLGEENVNRVYGGEFGKEGFFVDKSAEHSAWSYVYCNTAFGVLVTQNSLGFTWYKNSREMRLSEWVPDTVGYGTGEYIFLEYEGALYDLVALSDSVYYKRAFAEYKGTLHGMKYTVSVGCDPLLPAKMICVQTKGEIPGARLIYSFSPVMGNVKKHENVLNIQLEDKGACVRNLFGSSDFAAFLFGSDAAGYECTDECCRAVYDTKADGEYFFVLGARPALFRKTELYAKQRFMSTEDVFAAFDAYAKREEKLFSPIALNTGEYEYDLMANHYLPYQAYYVRMLAKTGFYQSSGAYGFRDQLQDSLAALYFKPAITARQIIRCAAHQYEEGDVQHWWHSTVGGGRFGIRSRYSDDCLWLPFALCEYIGATGDMSILSVNVNYLRSRPLDAYENERCETAERAPRADSIYAHCIRAIEHSLRFGERGLPLFLGGDWNDGMNKVGRAGRGESVWLAWFLMLVLEKFIPICISQNDDEHASKFNKIKGELLRAQKERAWDGNWYLRGFYDDGTPLGSRDSKECQIDIMAQSFAAFVTGDKEHAERTRTALYSVYDRLFDKKHGLLKLFDPPFDTSEEEPGYIKSYPAGIRENGGQYSHGAVWYAIALYAIGDKRRGRELLDALNPIIKCENYERAKIYRNEPYFMSGDIYTAKGHYGRGGWSGYTGSAAWYLRAILECLPSGTENDRKKLPYEKN